jgi:hypothetical protein
MVLPSYLLRESDEVQFCTCFEKPVKLKTIYQHIQKEMFFFFYIYFLLFDFFFYFLVKFYYLQNLKTT